MRFEVLMVVNKKIRTLCDVAQCSLIGVDQCFRSVYCYHHQGYDGGSMHI
jgi:hypothetical protein